MDKRRLLLVLLLATAIGAFFVLDLGDFLTLAAIKAQQGAFAALYAEYPLRSLAVYFLIYVAVTGLSLPGAALMSLIGAALFGLLPALVVVSFASSLGATLAFLVSRFLLRDWVQQRFGDKLRTVNEGVSRDGAFYLVGLRLVPVFPFFAINLLMGLTPMRTWTYYWISQLGMLPGTFVYVNAGTQLGQLESLSGILSPGLILSFTLLGIFPLLARRLMDVLAARRVYRGYPRPRRFDRNLVVIGAGSAGLVSAYIAAAVKARVSLVERERMGGDCLNTGCVPSKALIRTARAVALARRASEFGLKPLTPEVDFPAVMRRVHEVVAKVAPHDSVERYTGLGVEVLQGEARITSPFHVEVNGQTLSTRGIIVASGARPFLPPIPGLQELDYLTSDNLWDLQELPQRLLVLGGGPIGCELTQAFARLGSSVTQVEMLPRLLIREDPEVSEQVLRRFRAEGVDVRLEHKALAFRVEDGQKLLSCENPDGQYEIAFDRVLVAVGRRANVSGFGLQELGIDTGPGGTVAANDFLQTRFPNIYVCGDVAGPYQFTHSAAHQAWYAAVNALFGGFKRFKVDYRVIPWATFTDPEVARVGLNESEAKQQGIAYELTEFGIDDLDRAIAEGEEHGVVRVLTVPGRDRILGATIVGEQAGELITEFVTAMRHGLGLNKILATIHVYPTLAEANKYVAGNWRRAHTSARVLAWLARFHAWRRG